MGASSSTNQQDSIDRREAESIAAVTGGLPLLQASFSTLADLNFIPLDSLKKCLDLSYKKNPVSEGLSVTESFMGLLDNLGSSIVELFFVSDKDGVSWLEFVRGYNKCCLRTTSSTSLNMLLRVFAVVARNSGLGLSLEIESDDDSDCKISGFLKPVEVLLLIWLCWSMLWDSQSLKLSEPNGVFSLPDVSHIVKSVVTSCTEVGSGSNVLDQDILALEVEIPVGKFLTWVLQTLPSLPDCFSQFVHARIQSCGTKEVQDDSESSSSVVVGDISSTSSNILTRGVSWAISLTMRNSISEELSSLCFSRNSDDTDESLIYRSSLHGRGLNRFWSNIEGYQGPVLMLISASSQGTDERSERKWTIGALTQQGFENRESFHGSSGHLYALCPVFHSYASTGKEKNFVYSHLHPTGRLYEPHPKPVGIGFGGTVGNERVFIDEDFSKVTVRHHAVDKTYQHGFLFPDQGFLPVEALILEVEVWGLGGRRAKYVQDKYKKREELFTEQRRKIDLKTFANWEDSPEKIMMDMMGDPNAVRREER